MHVGYITNSWYVPTVPDVLHEGGKEGNRIE